MQNLSSDKVTVLAVVKTDKGEISLFILVILLIVCLLLPLYAFTLEKFAARNSINKIQDAITISVTSSYMALMPEFYTDGVIKLDQVLFELKLNKLLFENLERQYPGIEIIEEQIFCDELPAQCMRGKMFLNPGVHIVVRVPITYSAVRLLLPIEGEQLPKMTVHGDVLFTIDN